MRKALLNRCSVVSASALKSSASACRMSMSLLGSSISSRKRLHRVFIHFSARLHACNACMHAWNVCMHAYMYACNACMHALHAKTPFSADEQQPKSAAAQDSENSNDKQTAREKKRQEDTPRCKHQFYYYLHILCVEPASQTYTHLDWKNTFIFLYINIIIYMYTYIYKYVYIYACYFTITILCVLSSFISMQKYMHTHIYMHPYPFLLR